MGWFWADSAPSAAALAAPHPVSRLSDAKPPPSCPMHNKTLPAMTGKSSTTPAPAQATQPSSSESACPYVPPTNSTKSAIASTSSTLSKLNPLNYMPSNLSNTRAEQQKITLGLDREISTIPKGTGSSDGVWEYPSPQQMYNAMLRKGGDVPEDAVTSMVQVHNFLNEGAWSEILEWERRFAGGLAQGWSACKRGEDGARYTAADGDTWDGDCPDPPRLLRFEGRPTELTPKAQILRALGYVWPSQFGGEGPFDRHDWFVQRTLPDGSPKEIRYVIDYYSAPPEPSGEPVFFLDVRPAVDSPTAACERMLRWGGDVWWRGTGGSVREAMKQQQQQATQAVPARS